MIADKVKQFGKYEGLDGNAHDISNLTDFQQSLYENYDEPLIIGKARQQRVTTSFAHLAYYLAVFESQKIGVRLPRRRMFDNYLETISLHNGNISQGWRDRVDFQSGGSIEVISEYRSKKLDFLLIDEIGYSDYSIAHEIHAAAPSIDLDNIIVSVTLREKNSHVDRTFKERLNEMLWMIRQFPEFRYLEAWESETMLAEKDIQKYKSLL